MSVFSIINVASLCFREKLALTSFSVAALSLNCFINAKQFNRSADLITVMSSESTRYEVVKLLLAQNAFGYKLASSYHQILTLTEILRNTHIYIDLERCDSTI